MSVQVKIKKEDPLDFNSCGIGSYEDYENSMESSPSQPEQSTSKSRSNEINNATFEMPTKKELMAINDLTWKIQLQKYKKSQSLANEARTKVAKFLIKHIYNLKYEQHGHYDLKMSSHNLKYLADILVEIFPTEVKETYFIPSEKGRNATGKLYNAYVNTRAEIIDSGLLGTNRRNTERSDKSDSPMKSQPSKSLVTPEQFSGALAVCQSLDFKNLQQLFEKWDSSYHQRQNILKDRSALEYFNMFPYLKESSGYKLLINDAKRKLLLHDTIDRMNLINENILERLKRSCKGDSPAKSYLQNYSEGADQVVLSLILLPYLFTAMNKRAIAGQPKVTKLDMYHRFLPHFRSLTELEDYENTQNFNDKPVQVCVIGNLNDNPYSIIRVFNTKYHFGNPCDAMNVTFKIFLALSLPFPYESIQMWTFLKKFVYQLDDEKGTKIYPQVETIINEFNLYLKNLR